MPIHEHAANLLVNTPSVKCEFFDTLRDRLGGILDEKKSCDDRQPFPITTDIP